MIVNFEKFPLLCGGTLFVIILINMKKEKVVIDYSEQYIDLPNIVIIRATHGSLSRFLPSSQSVVYQGKCQKSISVKKLLYLN